MTLLQKMGDTVTVGGVYTALQLVASRPLWG